jgi:hypothetical protein
MARTGQREPRLEWSRARMSVSCLVVPLSTGERGIAMTKRHRKRRTFAIKHLVYEVHITPR